MSAGMNRYSVFLKAAELGSLTQAAQALHYTQSGVSHAIAALEQETGFLLFRRASGGVVLTEEGRQLLPAVRQLENARLALEQTVHNINSAVVGTLRLGTISSVSAGWLPEIITRFEAQYPLVQLELRDGEYAEIAQWIATGQVDCGFLTAPVESPLYFHPMKEDPFLVAMPLGHRLSEKAVISLVDLTGETFLMETENWNRDLKTAYGTLPPLQLRYLLSSASAVLAMVEKGLGLTICPELTLQSFGFHLTCRPLNPPKFRTLGIAAQPVERQSPVTRTFLQFLEQHAAEEFETRG